MKESFKTFVQVLGCAVLLLAGPSAITARSDAIFAIGEEDFLMNGKPFAIRSGEMHYPRIPREYWTHRLRMAHAMGLNTVSTYVFWNVHEPQPGKFDFSGNADIAEFCRLAQREGLKVLLRPGPYICGEWDFGGLPWWLLKDPKVRVRTRNPVFLDACRRYFKALGEQLARLQITKGGPIIMVQVENEYDGFGHDGQYIVALRDALVEAGFEVPFFSSEMTWSVRKNADDGLFRTVGLGRNPVADFQSLRAVQPSGPLMAGECYTGWFDRWGRGSVRSGNSSNLVNTLRWMLNHGTSFNLYMAHGGTSFGFFAGANDGPYLPQPTSYDYDAPISEAGWDTPKFYAVRELLAKSLAPGETLPEVPKRNPVIQIPPIEALEVAPITVNLPEAKRATHPQPMELYDQPAGCVLYRTKLPKGGGERLLIREVHDYAIVLLNGKTIATLDRGRKQDSVVLPPRKEETTLDLLVEAMGRVNFGDRMFDCKGITEKVELVKGSSPQELIDWEVFNLPLNKEELSTLKFQKGQAEGPAFYRARFALREVGDTFLDMREWGKGVVWVNGHNLGRFWAIGPQQTLYCPGPWLKKGANELVVLELNGAKKHSVAGLTEPILNEMNPRATGRVHRTPDQALNLTNLQPIHSGSFAPGGAWQTLKFTPTKGRYFCLEALNSYHDDEYATCAELDLLDADARALPRHGWKIIYADSEEVLAEDGGGDNVLDSRSDTYWHTQWEISKPKHPHQLVIDLGREETIGGLRYLPRQDKPNGQIRDFRLFLSTKPLPGL